MSVRGYYQEPPIRADMVGAARRVTSPWHVWFAYVAKQIGNRSVASVTADPPSLTTGARVSATVTVPGVKPGDFAVASFVTLDPDVALSAAVTAADTVTVWFTNNGSGTVDLASGTLRVQVEKR
jgi:hypothetical protein